MGYQKETIVTPSAYLHLTSPQIYNIQGTEQKPQAVNYSYSHQLALFKSDRRIPGVGASSDPVVVDW